MRSRQARNRGARRIRTHARRERRERLCSSSHRDGAELAERRISGPSGLSSGPITHQFLPLERVGLAILFKRIFELANNPRYVRELPIE